LEDFFNIRRFTIMKKQNSKSAIVLQIEVAKLARVCIFPRPLMTFGFEALREQWEGWEEVAPFPVMDWAGFEFASSVVIR
jgi:hypothetical protein